MASQMCIDFMLLSFWPWEDLFAEFPQPYFLKIDRQSQWLEKRYARQTVNGSRQDKWQ
jgi:hypothetical protein